MDEQQFTRGLAIDGFPPPVRVQRDTGELGEHRHAFEAKALVTQGELHIMVRGTERLYRAGDVFHLQPDEPHAERYGPQGVTYLVGRKEHGPG